MAVSTKPIDPLLELARIGRATDGASCDDDATDLAPAILLDAIADVSDTEAGVVIVREGVEAAYQRLYPQLVRLAFLLVDTNEHAEEAVQDAFAKAYSKWGRVENADSYMRMAVVNTCRRVQRRRMLARRTPNPAVGDAVLGADHVWDVVRRLPLNLRQVVVLRYYLQLSDPEIADTLGMPIGTVKSTLHRARAQMRGELS